MAKLSNKGIRNLRSAGNSAAKFTGRTTEKVAVGLFRWMTTDHSGVGKTLLNMPSMGFLDTTKHIFTQFLIGVAAAILTGVIAFLLITYGMPFLISRIF